MNQHQIANFVYWLMEYRDMRGLSDIHDPKEKLEAIKKLQMQFLEKYPNGILTGWTGNLKNY
jgi:hypothetical protein